MTVSLSSEEYQAWHEIGHAVVCIELGGYVEFVEFIPDENHYACARSRSSQLPEFRPLVLCGGYAAEYTLYKHGYLGNVDSALFFNESAFNSTLDKIKYFNVSNNHEFSNNQTEEFNQFAVAHVVPIIEKYLERISTMAKLLVDTRRLQGDVIQEIMQTENFIPYR